MERKNLIIDLVALVVYLVAANPALTGIGVHEWVGLGIFVVLFVHVLLHAGWVVDTAKSAFSAPGLTRTGNFVLDALMLVALVLCTVSGVMVSGAVLQALGLYAQGYFFWDPLHAASAKVLLALLLVHVVVHGRALVRFLRGDRR